MSVLRVVSVERGASTPPAVRSAPRSARGRCGGATKGRPHVWWTEQTRGGVCSVHHTCGHLLSPSCHDSSRRAWSGGRRRPRRCGARLGALTGGAEALPRDARTCGGPNRRAERLRPPVGVGALGDAGRGFRVQHSLNVPALVGYQLVVMCASFPRSVPRAAAPGGPPEGTAPTL